MSKKIITEKQRNLIINSNTAKTSFLELYNFLIEHSEVTREDLTIYPQLKNLQSYFDDLLNDCREEWEVLITQPTNNLGSNFMDSKVVCDLCGYKYLKIENNIQNKITKKKLVVGTECIKEFGETVQGMIKLAQRDGKRASNRLLLENTIPGIRKFVENSSSYTNTLDIIISENLEAKWRVVFNEIKKEYELFINSKSKDISKLLSSWNEKNLLVIEINRFIDNHKGKKFIANRKLLEWLLLNNKQEEIRMIRKNLGYVDWSISHRIYEPAFMRYILNELQRHFAGLNIEILNVDVSKLSVELLFKESSKTIKATIRYKDLILNYGGFVFGKTLDEGFREIYESSSISDTNSQDKILDLIVKEKLPYKLLNTYKAENEILYKGNDGYYLLNFSNLIMDLKKYYFSNEKIKGEISNVFHNNTIRVMNEKEYTNFKQMKEFSSDLKIR
ncbi:hypothetical protein MKZ20_20240 [Psychrobacillus sp. FSL K6-2684]|uniref:hypothetical protein n=1 Tax=Psychrobacillus sp. FSL K6-2684 TaxID=2921547 RepID=UPI0030FA5F59